MADRLVNQDATIYADRPGASAATVTLTNPLNVVAASAQTATMTAPGRFKYTQPTVFPEGIWTADWLFDDGGQLRQSFTVGRMGYGGITRWDLMLQTAGKVGRTHFGEAQDANGQNVSDPLLLGGYGTWEGSWVRFHPSVETEREKSYRISSANARALTLQPFLVGTPPDGSPYVISSVPWREIEQRVRECISELSPTGYVEFSLAGVPATADPLGTIVTVPRNMDSVSEVYSSASGKLRHIDWKMEVGRAIRLPSSVGAGESMTLVGSRPLVLPLWDDSGLDFDAGAISAKAASLIHKSRASGSGTDADDHMHRAIFEAQDAENAKKQAAGAILKGLRKVIE